MKPTKFQLSVLTLAVVTFIGFTAPSWAEVEKLHVTLFGFVNNDDARQIRRLLKPWADPGDVRFHNAVDAHGRESLFTTVVEITPRKGVSQYRERHTLDIYHIMRQLNDSRFRGSQSPSQPWVAKTEATVTGTLFAHAGWSRSYIRNVPFWRNWRGDTSVASHALIAGRWDQKIVFSDNDEFDQLKQEAGQRDGVVEIKGKIAGFDGPYPVMSVRTFRVEYAVEPPPKNDAAEPEEIP